MSEIKDIKIEASWKAALAESFQQPYFHAIKDFLQQERQAGKTIYPPGNLIFRAFDLLPLPKVKVVILGQDPYHGPNQAMGLSFSVPRSEKTPPSLKRIYQELESDIPGFKNPGHGDLSLWAERGVFLLNTILTVEQAQPGSHKNIGWEKFTDSVIQTLSEQAEALVFMLWGKPAQAKAKLIDGDKHLVLMAAHPSPLAGNAFFGNRHFSQANAFLSGKGLEPINWNLDPS